MIRFLLERGAGRIQVDGEILERASRKCSFATIQLLLEKGAKTTSYTLLGLISRHSVADVQLLLKRGADVNTPNEYGQTALAVAARNDNLPMMNMLLAEGAKDLSGIALKTESSFVDIEAVQLLIEHGISFYTQEIYGKAIFDASSSGVETAKLQLLLELGADVCTQHDYENAIAATLWSGHTANFQLLLTHRAE
ncbi:MAG: hypothetical protein M1835_003746, partial [Candelina submexicana]